MEKLPDPFNMIEIMGKVEERTPYVVVAFQVRAGRTFMSALLMLNIVCTYNLINRSARG